MRRRTVQPKIEDFSKDCPGTRYGASPARTTAMHGFFVWPVIFFLVLESQPSIIDVFFAFPMDVGRVLHYLLSYLSTVKGTQETLVLLPFVETKERTSACPKAPFYIVSTSPRQIFTFLLVPRSLLTLTLPIMANRRSLRPVASWKHAEAVPSVFFFFACSSPCAGRHGMSVDYEAEKGTPWEKACCWLPLAKWWGRSLPKAGDSKRLQGKRSKVRAGF